MSRLYLEGTEISLNGKIEEISFENGIAPEYISSVNRPLSSSEEVSFECEINASAFSKIMGVDLSRHGDLTSFTVEMSMPYLVQIRRHRQKRINKKWAKRYGYRTMFKKVQMTDAQIMQKGVNFEFEFTGEKIYVV